MRVALLTRAAIDRRMAHLFSAQRTGLLGRESPIAQEHVDRYQIDRSGAMSELGHLFLRAHLKEVPRSPGNPAGLIIV